MKIPYPIILALIILSGCMSHDGAILNAKISEIDKLYNNGQYLDARNICEKILCEYPNNEDATKSLGKIYQKLYGIDMAEQKKQRIDDNDDASEWSHIPGDYFVDENHVINKWGK